MESKECAKCGEVKHLCDFYKSKRHRDGFEGRCKECNKKASSKNYFKRMSNPDFAISRRSKENLRRSQPGEREKLSLAERERYHSSPINREKSRINSAKRKAAKLQRRPSWANEQLIDALHVEAKRLEELTGIQFHVDHIIPLQGELVSGLHVETNLQLLPAHENRSKSNSFDPETFCA